MTCKMCSITKLLIPPLKTHPLPLDSSTKNLKFIIPFFTNSKQCLYWPTRLPLHFDKIPSFINFAL